MTLKQQLELKQQIDRTINFLDKSVLKIKKPQINRKLTHFAISLKDEGLFIDPRIFICKGKVELRVKRGFFTGNYKSNDYRTYPGILEHMIGDGPIMNILRNISAIEYEDIMIRFNNHAKVLEYQKQIVIEIERIKQNKNKIFEEYKNRNKSKEVKTFKRKVVKLVMSVPELGSFDTNCFYALLNMDPKDIKSIAGFVKRNSKDMNFVNEDDVTESLREASVHQILNG